MLDKSRIPTAIKYLLVGSAITTALIYVLFLKVGCWLLLFVLWTYCLSLLGPLGSFYMMTLDYSLSYLLFTLLSSIVPIVFYYLWFFKSKGKWALFFATATWVLAGAFNAFGLIAASI